MPVIDFLSVQESLAGFVTTLFGLHEMFFYVLL